MKGQGIYVEMAHHPQVVLDALDEMQPAVTAAAVRQKVLSAVPIVLIALGFGGFFLTILLGMGMLPIFLWIFIVFGFILLPFLRSRSNPLLREHFEAARRILHTLRDDTGRKGRVVGWLDLSGPLRKEKTVRTARSGGGKKKVYYRDPWFKVKFKLVDGNVLRLTLEDKVKTKAGSITRHHSQFTAKLVVNPALYRVEPAANVYTRSGAILSAEDGILTVRAAGPAKSLSPRQVLETLKEMYARLELVGGPSPQQGDSGVAARAAGFATQARV